MCELLRPRQVFDTCTMPLQVMIKYLVLSRVFMMFPMPRHVLVTCLVPCLVMLHVLQCNVLGLVLWLLPSYGLFNSARNEQIWEAAKYLSSRQHFSNMVTASMTAIKILV